LDLQLPVQSVPITANVATDEINQIVLEISDVIISLLTSSGEDIGLVGSVGLWCLMPLSTIFQLYHGEKMIKEKLQVLIPRVDYIPFKQVFYMVMYITTQ
jgi:hypothetical protein